MKALYFDCQAGIAGDMTIAALLDLGLPLSHLRRELTGLPLPGTGYELTVTECLRQGVRGMRFEVATTGDQPQRRYCDIDAMLAASKLAAGVQETARRIFLRLAEAEAKVHSVAVGEVHFHEVGAVDSIVDIVGTAIGLAWFGVDRVLASPLPLGKGFIETAHGRLPVPAPATAELLKGLPLHDCIGPGERVTPTGAAIVAALAEGSSLPDGFVIEKIGHGAGSKDFPDTPNILRAFLGTTPAPAGEGGLAVMEANIDDCSPEILGYALERLLVAGALDVWFTPIQMKKNRPAVTLSLLVPAPAVARFTEIVLSETSAIGLRHYPVCRTVLARRTEIRATEFGPVSFKITPAGVKPEFDDCRRIATEAGLPLPEVYRRLHRPE